MKKNIALVAGGYSGEYEISIRSAGQISENINRDKYNVYTIVIEKSSWYYTLEGKPVEVDRNDFSLTINNEKITFDGALIIVHGTPGENGLLQGYFDMLNLPYTTCSALVSSITFDKEVCNALVRSFDIVNVAKNTSVFKDEELDISKIENTISLPMFVKPSEGGSSIGMSKVSCKEDILPAIEKAFAVHQKVLIEEFIEGREFSCGVMQVGEKEIIAFPATEIVSKTEFFDYDAKYNGLSDEITPAQISDELMKRVQETTKKLYKRLNCSGVCRIDFIYREKDDKLFFLEVNTTPGQSAQSIVPQQVRAMGRDTKWLYQTLLEQIGL
jgi:D-alanine-D-alanine ligase